MNLRRITLAVLLLTAFLPATATAQKIIVSAVDWYPYMSRSMEGNGFACEVVTYAFLAAGYETDYVFTTWEGSREKVVSGQVAAMIGYADDREKLSTLVFSEPIAVSRDVFFHKRRPSGDIAYKKLEDLKSYRIGAVRGSYPLSEFKKAGLTLDLSSDAAFAFKKLYIDMVDLVPENAFVGWAIINRLYPEEVYKFAETSRSLSEQTVHLVMAAGNPNSRTVMDDFNRGLQTLQAQGVYVNLLKKYIREVKIKTPKDPY